MQSLSSHIQESIYRNLGIEDAPAKNWVETYNNQDCVKSFKGVWGNDAGGFFAAYEDGVIKLPQYVYIEDPELLENGVLPSQFTFRWWKTDKEMISGIHITPLCDKLKSFDNFPMTSGGVSIAVFTRGTSIEKWNVPGPYIKQFDLRGPLRKGVKGIKYIDYLTVDLDIADGILTPIKDVTICKLHMVGNAFSDKAYKELDNFFKNNTFKCKKYYTQEVFIDITQLCVENYDFLKDRLESDATIYIWRHQSHDMGYLSDVMLHQIYGGLQQKHLKALRFDDPVQYARNAVDHSVMTSELGRCIELGIFKGSQVHFI